MTIKELIDLLSEYDADSNVLIQYMNVDTYGSCQQNTEYLDKDGIIGKGNTVILDISNK